MFDMHDHMTETLEAKSPKEEETIHDSSLSIQPLAPELIEEEKWEMNEIKEEDSEASMSPLLSL